MSDPVQQFGRRWADGATADPPSQLALLADALSASLARQEALAGQVEALAREQAALRLDLPATVAAAVKSAIQTVIDDPATPGKIFGVAKREARNAAGNVVMEYAGDAWKWLRRALVAAVVLWGLGGVPAVIAGWKALVAAWGKAQ